MYLEETIKSIINQNYDNIEYIIIDGGSRDNTVNIIKKYEKKIHKWLSEQDTGIYDAMNKGIELSSGDYLIFINSGDSFYSNRIISSIISKINMLSEDPDLIYGCFLLETGITHKPLPLSMLKKVMILGHPTLFCKTNILKENKFNIKYKISADYNFIVDCYFKNYKFYDSGLLISKYRGKGISSRNNLRRILEIFKIQIKFGLINAISNMIIALYQTGKKIVINKLKELIID
jgi:glycosyltransferase involved in cell wall biosynthesis